MEGVDFYAPETHITIRPSKEHPYSFQIINDDIIEDLENFTFSISPVGSIVQWKRGTNVVTTITIIDNDGKENTKTE